jgi:hypothetical protein
MNYYYLPSDFNFDFSAVTTSHIAVTYNFINKSITFPKNSIVYILGSKFTNCTLVGNNTKIVAKNYQIFDNCTFSGTWNNDEIYPEWFGAITNDAAINCSTFIQLACDNIGILGTKIKLSSGTYYCSTEIICSKDNTYIEGSGFNTIIRNITSGAITIYRTGEQVVNFTIENLKILGGTLGSAIELRGAYQVKIDRLYLQNFKNSINIKGMSYVNCAIINITNCIMYGGDYGIRFSLDIGAKGLSTSLGAGCVILQGNHITLKNRCAIYQSLLNDDWTEGQPISDKYIGYHYPELFLLNNILEGNAYSINLGALLLCVIEGNHFEDAVSTVWPNASAELNKGFAKILLGHSLYAQNISIKNNGFGSSGDIKLDTYLSFDNDNCPEELYKELDGEIYVAHQGSGIQNGEIKFNRFISCTNQVITSVTNALFELKYNTISGSGEHTLHNNLGTIIET